MARQEEKADLAAPGNVSTICEKCFAIFETGAEFCPECGAPVANSPAGVGSDVEVYPQLARANLLRMRGQYKQAEDVCLAILRRYPNNASSNTLLGDIAAEQGDFAKAADWYELALDILPGSEADRSKLLEVKRRAADRDAAAHARQLQIPDQKRPQTTFAVIAAILIAAVGLAAFIWGRNSQVVAANRPTIDRPTILPGESKPPSDRAEDGPNLPKKNDGPSTIVVWRPAEDSDLTQKLAGKVSDGNLLIDASQDPRTHNLRMTFLAEEGTDERAVAAHLASGAMEQDAAVTTVVVRGTRKNRLHYVATVHREDIVATTEAAWQDQHKGDDKAWLDAILKDEWRAEMPSPAPDEAPKQ